VSGENKHHGDPQRQGLHNMTQHEVAGEAYATTKAIMIAREQSAMATGFLPDSCS